MFREIKKAIIEEARINGNFINQNIELDSYLLKIEKYAMFHSVFTYNSLHGFVAFYANDLNDLEGFITLVHVSPKYRGKGIAKTLINTTFETMKVLGMKSCALEVLRSNSNAIYLYKSLGFKIVIDKSNHNVLYMTKKLDQEAKTCR
mgnify:CR=1 FL=1